jgi:hypothetical protein
MSRFSSIAVTTLAIGLVLVPIASAQQRAEPTTNSSIDGILGLARSMAVAKERAGALARGTVSAESQDNEDAPAAATTQNNGTNPASMSFKFMPYTRFTELENGVTSSDILTLFAMIPIPLTPATAINVEWPVQKSFDASAVVLPLLEGILDPEDGIPCAPPVCGGNRNLPEIPLEAVAAGFDQNGIGDLKLWFLQGLKLFGTPGEGKTTALLGGFQLNLPTASAPILGDEKWELSPMFAHIHNFSPVSFLAFMHLYTFDFADKNGISELHKESEVDFYLGRYFFQYAWAKSGWYILPELQVAYDFNSDNDWSAHFMPEVGKSFKAGSTGITTYIKPGWAVMSPDPSERSFSVEMGIRLIP